MMDYFLLTNNLTKATGRLDNLSNGNYFCYSLPITSWNINLPALTNGNSMFNGCKALTSFTSDLSALTDGTNMFGGCKLDLASAQNIADTINNLAAQNKTGNITIGILAELNNDADLAAALATIRNKGWTVTEQYN